MSYDLTFFNPGAAPLGEEAFQDWLDDIDENAEFSDDENVCVSDLKKFYQALSITFPSFEKSTEEYGSHATEYVFSKNVIEASFAFSVVPQLEKIALQLIKTHNVGIYDPQDGEISIVK